MIYVYELITFKHINISNDYGHSPGAQHLKRAPYYGISTICVFYEVEQLKKMPGPGPTGAPRPLYAGAMTMDKVKELFVAVFSFSFFFF